MSKKKRPAQPALPPSSLPPEQQLAAALEKQDAAAVAFALFAALYEDASDEPLNDAANDVEHLN